MVNRKSWFKKVVKIIAVVVSIAYLGPVVSVAQAASISSYSDNLSRLKASTLSDHEIKFVSPTGVAAGLTITLTFGTPGFSLGTFAVLNADFATGSTANCTSATYTEQTLAATPSGTTWGIATSSATTITLTSGTGTSVAGNCVRFRLGANAVTGGTGTSFITNGSAGASTATVVVGGTFGDSGTLFVPIITNDQVSISANVDPTISFSLSSNSIGFGSLASGNARYATGDTLGTSTEVSAHTLIAGTNATSGYIIYVKGDTLTSGANTITAIGSTAASSTPGSEQFGIRLSASGGSGTSLSPYNSASSYAYGASSTTQVSIAQATGTSANTTYSTFYVGNIAAQTEAGAYSATLTYTATGTF